MSKNGLTPDQRLAGRIAKRRAESGMTQHALARQMGVGDTVVSHWETGHRRPTLDNLRRLAEVLGVTLSSLVE